MDIRILMEHKLHTMDGSTIHWPVYETCFFDQKIVYPNLTLLIDHFNVIEQEFLMIKNNVPKLWHQWIENQLDVFPLYFFGKWTSIAKQYLPNTCHLLQQLGDSMVTANISCLKSHSQIQPHMGWGDLANHILRCHLGISVPDVCGCVCDNFVVMHKTKEWLVFDDSKMHSSFNYSDTHRFILIIDMKRPDTIPVGQCKLAYSDNLLKFIESFYNEDDINDIRKKISN